MKPKRPENETNEERFKRIAEARTQAVIEKLRLLGNCANERLYSYDTNDIERIFSAINGQVKNVRSKFYSEKYQGFKL